MKEFTEKFFRRGLLAMFLLLPLAYFPSFVSPYVTAKMFFFVGLVDVLVIAWVWLMVMDNRFRFSQKMLWFLAPVFLFLVALTISSLAGVDPLMSFFSSVQSGTGLIVLYHAFLFACMLGSAAKLYGKEFFRKSAVMIFWSSVVLSVLTFFTDTTLVNIGLPVLNNARGGAMMGNVLFLGTLLIFAIFLGLTLFVSETSKKKKIWYGIGIAIMALSPTFFIAPDIWKGLVPFSSIFSSPANILGGARMAALALFVGLISSGFIWLVVSRRTKVMKWVGILGLAGVVLVMGFGVYKAVTPDTSINNFFVQESGNRLIDWRAAVSGIKEKPFIGWGQENFRTVFQKNLDPRVFDPKQGNEVWTVHPHNSALEIMVNGGVVSFILYIVLLVALFTSIAMAYRKEIITGKQCALVVGMLIAYLIQNQMVFDTVTSYAILFGFIGIFVGLSLSNSATQERSGGRAHWAEISSAGYILGSTVTLVMIVSLFAFAFLPAGKVGALYHFSAGTSEDRTAGYQKLFTGSGSAILRTDLPVFLDSFIRSYDSQKRAILSDKNQQAVASAEIDALLAVLHPIWEKRTHDYHLSLAMVQLENLAIIFRSEFSKADVENAAGYASRGFSQSPNDPQIYVAFAQTLAYTGDIKGALAMTDKALSLNQNYTIAQKLRELLLAQ